MTKRSLCVKQEGQSPTRLQETLTRDIAYFRGGNMRKRIGLQKFCDSKLIHHDRLDRTPQRHTPYRYDQLLTFKEEPW